MAYAVDSLGNPQVYHTDGLGSVRAITDAAGKVVETYQTDEFGVATLTERYVSQPFQYTGEQRDGESGLVYLRARVYDPGIGRFLQRDPVVGVLARPSTLNRFSYVQNNPITHVDPSGMKSWALVPGFDPCSWTPGGFICNWWSSTFAGRKDQGKKRAGCPAEAANVGVGAIAGYPLQYRGASTDKGKQPCHVNAEVPIFGSRGSLINWHIYFNGSAFAGVATGLWTSGVQEAGVFGLDDPDLSAIADERLRRCILPLSDRPNGTQAADPVRRTATAVPARTNLVRPDGANLPASIQPASCCRMGLRGRLLLHAPGQL